MESIGNVKRPLRNDFRSAPKKVKRRGFLDRLINGIIKCITGRDIIKEEQKQQEQQERDAARAEMCRSLAADFDRLANLKAGNPREQKVMSDAFLLVGGLFK